MSVTIIGGMKRLERQYEDEAKRMGITLRVLNDDDKSIGSKLRKSDAVVIFTNKVSHNARNQAVSTAKQMGIPVYMHHACGLCSLRECLKCLLIINGGSEASTCSI